jgi:hypothetical protein
VVLVFLRFLLCLLLMVLLHRLLPRLSCGRQFRLFYPLLRDSIRVSTSSIVIRIVILLATAPTATGMDTLHPTVIRGPNTLSSSCWESCLSCCHSSRHLLSCSYSESVCLSSCHCSL